MAIKRTSHSVYEAEYHLVWCPKYRKDVFAGEEIRERAKQVLRDVAEAYGMEIGEMEVAADHVHILLSFPPQRSIGEVVRILKSCAARQLFREFPSLKRRLWGGELWNDGYFARTVGDRMTSETIRKYILAHEHMKQGPAQLQMKLR